MASGGGDRPPNLDEAGYEGHFSEQLWQLTLGNFDTRKEEAFRKIRQIGRHCSLTIAGVLQKYNDGAHDQVAYDVMLSMVKENYGTEEAVVELDSGDINVQSYGAGVVLIKVKNENKGKVTEKRTC